MDPYLEQRLRDEVLYLHSLWHQGPTRTTVDYSSGPLQPSNSTHFKKPGKTRRGKRSGIAHNSNISSGIEWPVDPPSDSPPRTTCGWPELKLKPNPTVHLPSPEELARHNWNQVQQKALKAAQEFFSSNADSDGEDDESDEDDIMEDDVACENEYTFFLNLLTEESEVKSYLKKNCGGGGDFCCLVCGGAGEKFGKRFKDCLALIQHSVTIAKTKKRRAHRAYGQAICKVLGWEIDQLPSIASTLKSRELQVNAGEADQGSNALTSNVASVNVVNGVAVLEMDSNACETLPDKASEFSNAMEGELMVCETSVPVTGSSINAGAPDQQVVNVVVGNAEGVVTSLKSVKEDGVGSSSGNAVSDIWINNVAHDSPVKHNTQS